jgi:hypothetical protein
MKIGNSTTDMAQKKVGYPPNWCFLPIGNPPDNEKIFKKLHSDITCLLLTCYVPEKCHIIAIFEIFLRVLFDRKPLNMYPTSRRSSGSWSFDSKEQPKQEKCPRLFSNCRGQFSRGYK